MRLVLFSDVRSNLPALDAVLCLAEAIACAEFLEIREPIGWRLVVVSYPELERDSRRPGNGL
jgi:hypothetical protein